MVFFIVTDIKGWIVLLFFGGPGLGMLNILHYAEQFYAIKKNNNPPKIPIALHH